MKPEKLIISAWGPYPGLEQIDFGQLGREGVFLITGPTGAGKTTLFDAISYGLYGNVSGNVREKTSVRSDFAPADTATFVTLEFTHHGEKYRVTRSPKYSRPKKRGKGEIAEPEKAELEMPNGKLYTSVSQVNEQLVGLLGINHEQFKQVSMIAQGEFMELLTADSAKRVEIFRSIFGTGIFNRIQSLLGEKSRKLYYEIEDLRHRLDESAAGIVSEGNEALSCKLDSQPRNYPEIYELLKAEVAACRAEGQALTAWLDQQSEKVSRLTLAVSKVAQQEKALGDCSRKLEELRQRCRALEAEKEGILQRWDGRADLEGRIETCSGKLLHCEDHIRWCQEFTGLRKNYESAGKQVQTLLAEQERLLKREAARVLAIEKQRAQLTEYDGIAEALAAGRTVEAAAAQNVLRAEVYVQLCSRGVQLRAEYAARQKVYTQVNRDYVKSEQAFSRGEQLSRQAAAGLLARDLEEGMPCPVCGSTHHLAYAPMASDVPSPEELKALKADMEQRRQTMMTALDGAVAARGQFEAIEKEVLGGAGDMEALAVTASESSETSAPVVETVEDARKLALRVDKLWKERHRSIAAQLNRLSKKAEKRQQLLAALDELTSDLEALKMQLAEVSQSLSESRLVQQAAQGRMDGAMERLRRALPPEVSDHPDEKLFRQQKRELEAALKSMKKERDDLERDYRDIFTRLSSAQALLANEEKNLKVLGEKLESARKSYGRCLEKVDISEYGGSEGCDPDAADSKAYIDFLQRQFREKQGARDQLQIRLAHNGRALEAIKEKLEQESVLVRRYGYVKDLDNAARGNNEQKLTFEQYVLGAYFDEVLTAANLRLDRMSRGRYAMMRVNRVLDHRRTNSLDIEVMDYYTGKRRSVRTLSGGESFNAALSLALGLSDVIQCHAGGIEIETLFVDEGFGSLDEAALQSAVDTLMMVTREHHMTGIISHVQELKERIERQIVVEKGRGGSTLKL